ncbi:hypothetical protein AB0436_04195 [Streptomyces sp. NPDC051322]|uniref:hypothetical protein n=1 Tax=Streptomyces sp. NPDC051322 TaxID=3154645 RepID=UPI00344CEC9C
MLDDVVAAQDAMRSAREVGGGVLTVMCTPDMSGEAVASWAGGFTQSWASNGFCWYGRGGISRGSAAPLGNR